MVLYVIGLGLGDEKDITVRGLEAVRGSAKVVLEHYTSILGVDKAKLVRVFVRSMSPSPVCGHLRIIENSRSSPWLVGATVGCVMFVQRSVSSV